MARLCYPTLILQHMLWYKPIVVNRIDTGLGTWFVKILRRVCVKTDDTHCVSNCVTSFNTLRQNRRHFGDDIFNCIFFNENVWNPIEISLKFVPKGQINNIPSLDSYNGLTPSRRQAIIWTNDGLPTHICVTRPHWVIYQTIGFGSLCAVAH